MKRKITIHGITFEVTEEGYKAYEEYERDRKRISYLKCLDKKHDLASIEWLHKDAESETYLVDENVNIEDEVVKKLMIEKLKAAMKRLTKEELDLIFEIYVNGKSQHEVSRETKIPQTTIGYRLSKILEKLKGFMDL